MAPIEAAAMMQQPRVLAVTKHVVAVNKPPGMSFHNDQKEAAGLVVALRELDLPPLYAVHRLDRCTSGIVLLGTSPEAAGLLTAAFRQHAVQKYYVALSDRKPAKKQGSVVGDMTRGRRGGWMLLRTKSDPAITRFWSQGLGDVAPGLRLYVLKPATGRTHQLRVALKSLGAPICGDETYAQADAARLHDRTYLHAAAIRVPALTAEEPPLELVCRPDEGALFQHPLFMAAFDELFSWQTCLSPGGFTPVSFGPADSRSGMEDGEDNKQQGVSSRGSPVVWFPEQPLLRSHPPEPMLGQGQSGRVGSI